MAYEAEISLQAILERLADHAERGSPQRVRLETPDGYYEGEVTTPVDYYSAGHPEVGRYLAGQQRPDLASAQQFVYLRNVISASDVEPRRSAFRRFRVLDVIDLTLDMTPETQRQIEGLDSADNLSTSRGRP